MGLDFNSLFNQAKQAVNQGMNDLLKTGGNAAIGYLENQAVALIQADQKQHEAEFQTNVADILKRPGAADSFGSYLSNVSQSPVIKEYGGYILGAVVGIAIVTLLLK
jgi:hypothetical protein